MSGLLEGAEARRVGQQQAASNIHARKSRAEPSHTGLSYLPLFDGNMRVYNTWMLLRH
jgi:hypothetical protein